MLVLSVNLNSDIDAERQPPYLAFVYAKIIRLIVRAFLNLIPLIKVLLRHSISSRFSIHFIITHKNERPSEEGRRHSFCRSDYRAARIAAGLMIQKAKARNARNHEPKFVTKATAIDPTCAGIDQYWQATSKYTTPIFRATAPQTDKSASIFILSSNNNYP